jgi:DNA-directed RNA polymerase subunit delta
MSVFQKIELLDWKSEVMMKKRSIIAYENLDENQRKRLSRQYPEGFQGQLTEIKKPNGEILDALIWETEEIIYLVKMTKAMSILLDEEDDDYVGANEDSSEDIDVDED